MTDRLSQSNLKKIASKYLQLTSNLLKKHITPNWFGFRSGHSIIEQIHKTFNVFNKYLEGMKYCLKHFLVSKKPLIRSGCLIYFISWNRVCLNQFTLSYVTTLVIVFFFGWNIIRNYLSMTFSLTFLNASSWTNFVFYLHCRPSNFRNVTVASFLDDTAILAIDDDSMLSTDKLQSGLVLVVNRWLTKWKIKINLLIAHEFNWMIFIPLLTT